MNFIKRVLATIIGFFISIFLLFILTSIVFASMILGIQKFQPRTENTQASILYVNPNYVIPQRTKSVFDISAYSFSANPPIGLDEMISCIHKAQLDDNIKGIYFQMGSMPNGWATATTIRQALKTFKASGKPVIAYGEIASQKSYYIASVADSIFLNPEGIIDFRGFGSQFTFFKDAIQRLGIDVQFFSAGTYKSAFEPLKYNKMSDANREQITRLLTDFYQYFQTQISQSRNISSKKLFELANTYKIQQASDAVKYHLIDGLKYADEVRSDFLKQNTSKINFSSLNKYAKATKQNKTNIHEHIAIVYMEGNIIDGKGQEGDIGSKKYAKVLKQLRKDESVKAVILRINSGGGSSLASDVIWREVWLTKQKKPLIVSFNNIAASGAYYLSSCADKIFAQPTSITGSIGVFGIVPNFKKIYNKIGIHIDEVKLQQYAISGGLTRPLNTLEKRVVQKSIDRIYNVFLQRVSQGRTMSKASVQKVAQGRVWSGIAALENGLVDTLAGMHTAIDYTAKKVGLSPYAIKAYPNQDLNYFFEQIAQGEMRFLSNLKNKWIKKTMGESYTLYKHIDKLHNIHPYQARMPFDIQIE